MCAQRPGRQEPRIRRRVGGHPRCAAVRLDPGLGGKGTRVGRPLLRRPRFARVLDLDLLVEPGDVARAAGVLESRGYAPHLPLAPGMLDRLVRTDSELLFRRWDGRRLCDLHWALMPRGYSFSPDATGVFAQRQLVRIGAAEVQTLGSAATLLFLLLHGMKHDWASLGWVCDVAELLRREPGLDWDAVLAWSRVPDAGASSTSGCYWRISCWTRLCLRSRCAAAMRIR